jgi:c(7)-type cytochrome triheme protein
MKVIALVVAVMVFMAFAGSAMAVPAGKTVEFDNPQGKVTFDGKLHADKGLKCNDCHPKIFQMKKGADKMTMADMNAGKFCGECHNGTKAFKTDDPANCAKCHKK